MTRGITRVNLDIPATPPFTVWEVVLLSGHLEFIFREVGHARMAVRGECADVTITPATNSAEDIWAQVTINGHACGNRYGGAQAYARLMAGDPEWFRP